MRCTLALTELREGRVDQARAAMDPVLPGDDLDEPGLGAAAHGVWAALAAATGDWTALDAHLEDCERLFPLLSSRSAVPGQAVELAGDLASERRQRRRMVRAWMVAQARAAALGDEVESQRLLERISAVTVT
jgi:hypothetical protein